MAEGASRSAVDQVAAAYGKECAEDVSRFVLGVDIVEDDEEFVGLAGDGIERVVKVFAEADGDADCEEEYSDGGHHEGFTEACCGSEEFADAVATDHPGTSSGACLFILAA